MEKESGKGLLEAKMGREDLKEDGKGYEEKVERERVDMKWERKSER